MPIMGDSEMMRSLIFADLSGYEDGPLRGQKAPLINSGLFSFDNGLKTQKNKGSVENVHSEIWNLLQVFIIFPKILQFYS